MADNQTFDICARIILSVLDLFSMPETWRHEDMKTFSALLALYEEKPTDAGGFPHKGSVITYTFLCSSICWAWASSWTVWL